MATERKSASSLVTRLLAVQLPLVGLVVVGFLAFLAFDFEAGQRAAMIRDTARALDGLEPALARTVRDEDAAASQRLVAEFGQLPQVQSAMLTTPDGRVLARIGDPTLPVGGADLQIERTLTLRGEAIGLFDVALTTRPILAEMSKSLMAGGLLLLAVLGGLAVATAVASRLVIQPPLAALRRSLDAARRGSGLRPASWQGGDELGEAVRAINEAQQAQAAADEALQRRLAGLQDLADRRAEELAERQAVFAAVLDSLPVGVGVFDKDRRLIAGNRPFMASGDGADAGSWGEGDDVVSREDPTVVERRLPDGRYVEVRNGPLAGGGFVSLHADISERKAMEQALRAAVVENERGAERLRQLADGLPAMVFSFAAGPDGGWLLGDVGAAMREAFALGEAGDAETTERFIACIHPDDRAETLAALGAAVRERGAFHRSFRMRDPNGCVRWLEAAARPSVDAGGASRWDGLILDVTRRREAEEALREGEAWLHAILEAAPSGAGVVARDGCIAFVNPSLAAMVDRTAEELRGLPLRELCLDPAAGEAIARRLAAGDGVHRQDMALKRSDGSPVPVLVTLFPGRDDGSSFAWIHDLSDRKRAEQLLAEREASAVAVAMEEKAPDAGAEVHAQVLAEPEPAPDVADHVPVPAAAAGGEADEPAAVDERLLRETFGGDERTVREVMADFVAPARGLVADIRQAQAGRSGGAVRQAARSLTSAARAVGAQELADLCQVLERAARDEAWDEIDADLDRLEAAFAAVVAYIAARPADQTAAAGKA